MSEYAPLQLYSWATPNGQKVHIMLEELALPYELHPVDIGKGEQFEPGFLRISPNNKIPAIVDNDGPERTGEKGLRRRSVAIFESGAILLYLAEKTGRFLMPEHDVPRYLALQWLFFQVGGAGPMFGQAHYFRNYAEEEVPHAIDRYTNESNRLFGVMNTRLGDAPYFAGADYSIADIALYPWTLQAERKGVDIDDYPHVKRWQQDVAARPAVQRGMEVLADRKRDISGDDKQVLFGRR